MARLGSSRAVAGGALASLLACGGVEVAPSEDAGVGADGSVEVDFEVRVTQARAFLRQGEAIEVDVEVERRGAFRGPIQVAPRALPSGVTADSLTIPEDGTAGTLVLTAAEDSTQGAVALEIEGFVDGVSSIAGLRLLVAGEPGTVDLSFGDDGVFQTKVGGLQTLGRGLAVQPDGRLLITGRTISGTGESRGFLLRLDETGDADADFGEAGVASVGNVKSTGGEVVILHEDRIVVAGWAGAVEDDAALFAFTPDGVVDESFGEGGAAVVDLGVGRGQIDALLASPTEGLVAVAVQSDNGNVSHVLRFAADGSRDPGFGGLLASKGSLTCYSAVLAGGRVVTAGSDGTDFWMARLGEAGALDPDFGSGGSVVTPFEGDFRFSSAHGVVVSAGGFLSVGQSDSFFAGDLPVLALTRHDTRGRPDLSFAPEGKIFTNTPFETVGANAAIVDGEGRVLVAGLLPDVATANLAVLRLLPDASLDTAFGEVGRASVRVGESEESLSAGAYALAVDADGRIVLSGIAGATGFEYLVVTRLWP